MKVLLINPPSDSPRPVMPLGLAYLAAMLEKNNIPVKVIDAWVDRLDYDSLGRRIFELEGVDLIGVTVMSPVYSSAVKTIKTARKASPKSKIIIGGTHPSSLPEECLRDNPEVDFVAIGEGDQLIVEIVESMMGNSRELHDIKGLAYRHNGRIINNGSADPVKNLDDLPFPARHLFPMFKYRTHPPYRLYSSYATIMTSRGCPFQCTYCTKSVSGQNYRAQSPGHVIEEIEYLINNYDIRQIHFYDDDFTINMKRVDSICDKIIEKGINIVWSCVTRVDLVNEALLKKMRKAGCWLISYGVESGNQEILNNVKRGYSVEQIRKAIRLTKKTGIRTLGYFIAGLPGETYATLNDTIELSLLLDTDFVSWSITALYPGSKLYQQAINGELGNNYVQLGKSIAQSKSNISSVSPYSHGHIFIYEGDIPRECILKRVNQAYRKFYFRIGYLLKFLLKLQTITEFYSYCIAFVQFIIWKIKK